MKRKPGQQKRMKRRQSDEHDAVLHDHTVIGKVRTDTSWKLLQL